MQYYEIVEKVRNNERLPITEVSGFQLIMLMQDREVKNIGYHGNVFEVNFIPITYAFETFRAGEKIIEHWIHCYDVKKAIYVQIENEYFEVILDLLESAE